MEDWGEVELINAIRYKEDPACKMPKILTALVGVISGAIVAICAYIFVTNMFQQLFFSSLLGAGGFKFKFTTELIVAIVFLAVGFRVDLVFNNEIKNAIKWAEKQKANEEE